jgi:ankyrin repeat protein
MDLLTFKTPLHEAAHNAQVDKVKDLLAAGASVAEVDSLDQTPLIMAVRRRSENEADTERMAECAKVLIEAGASVNAFDKNGEACIHLAVMSGGGVEKVAVLKTLLDANADTSLVSDTFKMTALQYAFAALLPPARCAVDIAIAPASPACARTHLGGST